MSVDNGTPRKPVLHFACDRCGFYWQAHEAEACPECGAGRVWEFDRARPAREHAAHIARGHQSGIFREAR